LAAAQRRAAQEPVEAIHDKLSNKKFPRRSAALVKRIRASDEGTCDGRFACMARVALGAMVGPYLKAGSAELANAEALHAFRIQGKQIRYAMEIFAGAFDEDFRQELYPVVASLQERLGSINDHATAQTYIGRWLTETQTC